MIIRSPRSRNFTVIGNEIFDTGLSLEAIGLLCFLLSRYDNWRIMPAHLANKFGGRDRTYRILKELVAAFYISRRKLMTGEMEYTVFDVPTPDPEKPDEVQISLFLKSPITAKPDPEKPDVLTRTDSKQELIDQPKLIGSTVALRASLGSNWPSDKFQQFWSIYPNKVGKPVAEKSFKKAEQRCPDWGIFWPGVLRYVHKTDDRPWLNPSTFLNQDRYADQPASASSALKAPSFFSEAMGVIGDGQR